MAVLFFVSSAEGLRPCAAGQMFADGRCEPCLDHATCDNDALLESVYIHRGFWRLSNLSRELLRCRQGDFNATACLGGKSVGVEGDGYCVNGTKGPRCEACQTDHHYFDEASASCIECEATSRVVLRLVLILLGVCLVLGGTAAWLRRWLSDSTIKGGSWLSRKLDLAACRLWILVRSTISLLPLLKLCFIFAQTIGLLSRVYAVRIPPQYQHLWDVIAPSFGIQDLLGHTSCLGGFHAVLLLTGLLPLAVILAAMLLRGVVELRSQPRRALGLAEMRRALLAAVPVALLGVYICVPTVSFIIFSAFNCKAYEDSSASGTSKAYLLEDASILCYESDEYFRIRTSAITLAVVWPVGGPALCLSLLRACRSSLMHGKSNALVQATAFLHRDFRANFFYWEVVTLVLRILLNGALVAMLDEREHLLRLLVALQLSISMLLVTAWCQPFRMFSWNNVSVVTWGALSWTFLGAVCLHLYDAISDELQITRAFRLSAVMGVLTPEFSSLLMLIFAFGLLLLLISISSTDLGVSFFLPRFLQVAQAHSLPPSVLFRRVARRKLRRVWGHILHRLRIDEVRASSCRAEAYAWRVRLAAQHQRPHVDTPAAIVPVVIGSVATLYIDSVFPRTACFVQVDTAAFVLRWSARHWISLHTVETVMRSKITETRRSRTSTRSSRTSRVTTRKVSTKERRDADSRGENLQSLGLTYTDGQGEARLLVLELPASHARTWQAALEALLNTASNPRPTVAHWTWCLSCMQSAGGNPLFLSRSKLPALMNRANVGTLLARNAVMEEASLPSWLSAGASVLNARQVSSILLSLSTTQPDVQRLFHEYAGTAMSQSQWEEFVRREQVRTLVAVEDSNNSAGEPSSELLEDSVQIASEELRASKHGLDLLQFRQLMLSTRNDAVGPPCAADLWHPLAQYWTATSHKYSGGIRTHAAARSLGTV